MVTENRCIKTAAFDDLYFRSISRIWWKKFVNNSELEYKVLGPGVIFLEQALSQNRLGFLEHFCRCPKKDCLVAVCSPSQVVVERWFDVSNQGHGRQL